MAKNWTKAEKQEAARKALKKLQAKFDKSGALSPQEVEKQYAALDQLADVNLKTMTVEAAYEWAEEFVRAHPNPHAISWAWRMVGHVEAYSNAPRGPKPQAELPEVDAIYFQIVRSALRLQKLPPLSLTKDQLDELEARVNSLCANQLLPKLERQSLRSVLREISTKKGR